VVRRGRPLSEGAERTPTLRIFRGSRGGMWWKRHRAGREAHGGAGVEPATEAYKGNRRRRGLSWESEGFIVPIEGEGQHNPARGKGPYFVHVSNEWRIRGLPSCYQPRLRSGRYRGNSIGRPSLNQLPGWTQAHASGRRTSESRVWENHTHGLMRGRW
jgi:hypothetical protein